MLGVLSLPPSSEEPAGTETHWAPCWPSAQAAHPTPASDLERLPSAASPLRSLAHLHGGAAVWPG